MIAGVRTHHRLLGGPGLATFWPECRTMWSSHLTHEPDKTSRGRIKRLRGLFRPRYRLRVEGVPVFYDITGRTVEVLAIVRQAEVDS